MSGFAYRITDSRAERVDLKTAFDGACDLAWVHLSTTDERAQGWLRERAGVEPM